MTGTSLFNYPRYRRKRGNRRVIPSDFPPAEARAIRDRLGLTLHQMAKCFAVNSIVVRAWEQGERPIDVGVAQRYRHISELADHLFARRAKPDWTL